MPFHFLVVTQNCKFALRSRSNAPLLLPSSSSSSSFGSDFFPKQKGGGGTIVTLRTSSESERRQWVNVISEAIFNFKNKEALESSNTMAGFTPSSHSFVHVGNLVLKLERASELLPVDRGITSHPYCVIRWNECVLKSRVIPNTINPAWDEVCYFLILLSHRTLSFKFMIRSIGSFPSSCTIIESIPRTNILDEPK